MHASLDQSQRITRVLDYHEAKVRQGKAELIGGDNFIKEPLDLSYDEKLYHFNRLIDLKNEGYKPVLHVFVRFSRRDELDSVVMHKIVQRYMEEIGYGKQPWLAYRHRDTLHPHVHLVSTIRLSDGNRMPLSLQLLRRSREVTHRLEKEYGLDQER